jgi:hypothetical protein
MEILGLIKIAVVASLSHNSLFMTNNFKCQGKILGCVPIVGEKEMAYPLGEVKPNKTPS